MKFENSAGFHNFILQSMRAGDLITSRSNLVDKGNSSDKEKPRQDGLNSRNSYLARSISHGLDDIESADIKLGLLKSSFLKLPHPDENNESRFDEQVFAPYDSTRSQETIESVSHRIHGGYVALKDVASSVISRQCNFIVERLAYHLQGDELQPEKQGHGEVTYSITVDLSWLTSSEPCDLKVRMACTDRTKTINSAAHYPALNAEAQPASIIDARLLPPRPWIESPRSVMVAVAEAASSSPLERLHEGLRLVPAEGTLLSSGSAAQLKNCILPNRFSKILTFQCLNNLISR